MSNNTIVELTSDELVTATGGAGKLTAAGTAVLGLLGGEPLPEIQRPAPNPSSITRTVQPIRPLLPAGVTIK